LTDSSHAFDGFPKDIIIQKEVKMHYLKVALLYASLLLAAIGSSAQAPDWLWAQTAGGTNNDYGWDLATDDSGNCYVTGYFEGAADFGSVSLIGGGGYNFYVGKLDTSGNWQWAKSIDALTSQGNGIAVDPSGNCHVMGSFLLTAIIGDTTLVSAGGSDVFIAKLDSAGNWLWVRQIGGSGSEYCHQGIALDSYGDIYVTGHFEQSVTIGSSTLSSTGGMDVFIAKLDSGGNWLWARRAGGSAYDDMGLGIATDSASNCYVTGVFYGSADFGPTTLTTSGISDIFIVKLDGNGNWLWAKRAGGIDTDAGYSIATMADGSSYLTGSFRRTADFGDHTLISVNQYPDICIARIDCDGNWLWARRAGSADYGDGDHGHGIVVNSCGDCFVTGRFLGTADFVTSILTSRGSSDVFVAALDAFGNWLWAKRSGGQGWDSGLAISTDPQGNVLVTGIFFGTATFSPIGITSVGGQDIFIAKLSLAVENNDPQAPEPPPFSILYDPHPNPFRKGDRVIIDARIADGETGFLTICNLRGQIIVIQQLGPGTHQISFNTHCLASGIYLCKLRTPSVNSARKLILLK